MSIRHRTQEFDISTGIFCEVAFTSAGLKNSTIPRLQSELYACRARYLYEISHVVNPLRL